MYNSVIINKINFFYNFLVLNFDTSLGCLLFLGMACNNLVKH